MLVRKVRGVTERDLDALRTVRKAGFVGVEQGGVFLETNTQISLYRFKRLLAHCFLTPSEDGLLSVYSQTYTIAPDAP